MGKVHCRVGNSERPKTLLPALFSSYFAGFPIHPDWLSTTEAVDIAVQSTGVSSGGKPRTSGLASIDA